MPPRHGKSEVASVRFPAWFLGKNPKKSIIAASYNSEFAQGFGRQVRNIVSSQEFKNVFGDVELAEDSTAKSRWNTKDGGSYFAVGVGGSLTGRGADCLIIDDAYKNRQDADSDVIRESILNWYKSAARTRLAPNGAIIIIQTRWHDEDLSGYILSHEGKEDWEVINLKAIAEEDEPHRKMGEPLWDSQYSLKDLQDIKRDIGSFEWSALYQQSPIDSEHQEFRKQWFQYVPFDSLNRMNTNCFVSIDTAVSQRDSADYTGIVHNYVDRDNKWFIKAYRQKITPTELIDLIFKIYDEDKPVKIGIEKTVYLQAIKPFIDEECRKRNKFPTIVELKHNQIQKEIRIRGLIPRYETHSIFHIEGWCDELEEELLRFPKGVHDDVADALAYQSELAHAPYAPSRQELVENYQMRKRNTQNYNR